MPESIAIQDFLHRAKTLPIIDVRTPAEFAHAHLPNAHNLPLFTNEERAVVGTAYKQASRETAILLGLDAVGGKMRTIAEEALHIAPEKTVLLYCWRGGMRSGSVAWLLELLGIKVWTLRGGYKAFRAHCLEILSQLTSTPYQIKVLGGYTGSQKTQILHVLSEMGEQVLDLEALAHHKGSVFGALGEVPQPSNEDFENHIALTLKNFDSNKPIWIEDESRLIGRCTLPEPLWDCIRTAQVFFLDIPLHERVQHLCDVYGTFPRESLHNALLHIEKRLGGKETRAALTSLMEGNLATTAEIALSYYDKTYLRGLERRVPENVHRLSFSEISIQDIANTLRAT